MTTAPRTRKPRRTLTPVKVTQRSPSPRGRMETWEARSDDGVWLYERLEIPGTPWLVSHLPSRTEGHFYGTLDDAREATASGAATAYVELLLAHGRGEHEAERVPLCGRC